MRKQYAEETVDSIPYWNELAKQFKGTFEMDFVSEQLYGKSKQKLKEYITVLLHTRSFFSTLEQIEEHLAYLYIEPGRKFNDELEPIKFLKDAEYTIVGELIRQYEAYSQERYEKEEIAKKQREKEQLEQQKREREQRE